MRLMARVSHNYHLAEAGSRYDAALDAVQTSGLFTDIERIGWESLTAVAPQNVTEAELWSIFERADGAGWLALAATELTSKDASRQALESVTYDHLAYWSGVVVLNRDARAETAPTSPS